jgi:nicotinamidase-related amidase
MFGLADLSAAETALLSLPTRARAESAKGSGEWNVVERTVELDPTKTAIVICDMWNEHWCQGATRRVAEMAPRLNEVVKKAREQGVFIIHCPSDTMKFYEGTPGRKLAQAAPKAEPKVPLQRWCSLDQSKEAPLPINDADGGCDDWPQCKHPPYPWTRQIEAIEIKDGDAITDSAEAYYLMQQRGIDNVIVMGVHLNMCVLGRPFSIRQMVNQGKKVLLMRDMTDTILTRASALRSARHRHRPDDRARRTLLVPDDQQRGVFGGQEFRLSEDKRRRVVFLIGEDEYKTWETLSLRNRTSNGVVCR